jgi:hypothetical protein
LFVLRSRHRTCTQTPERPITQQNRSRHVASKRSLEQKSSQCVVDAALYIQRPNGRPASPIKKDRSDRVAKPLQCLSFASLAEMLEIKKFVTRMEREDNDVLRRMLRGWVFGWRTRNTPLVLFWFPTPHHVAKLLVSATHLAEENGLLTSCGSRGRCGSRWTCGR